MGIYAERVSGTIGDTPLVRINRVSDGVKATVAVKIEAANPGGSVKDRIAKSMVDDAEERGLIEPGRSVLVEPTSGNTGIALAMVGAERGYRVVLTMPESMSLERRRLLKALGAELILTPAEKGMKGAIEAAEEFARETQGSFIPGQFDNPANPRIHYETTGPEIAEALGEAPAVFVAGVGTGGTVSGAGRYLKERFGDVRVVAVEPEDSPVISQTLAGQEPTPGPHLIQGIGAGFIPATLDLGVLDEVIRVSGEDAVATARRMAREEGLFVGISSGANLWAALQVASRPEHEGATVVTLAPSTGERYLSTVLWEDA
ncbi:MAG: cysteine synthase A [Coriobacteriia bacterium]